MLGREGIEPCPLLPPRPSQGLAAGTIAYASAWHPAKPDVFASVSDNGEVVIWCGAILDLCFWKPSWSWWLLAANVRSGFEKRCA